MPTPVTLKGDCRYHLVSRRLRPLSGEGISNEAEGVFSLSSEGPVLLQFPQENYPPQIIPKAQS